MITSELLEAYLACPTKCYLRSSREECSENRFAALYQIQKDSYHHAGIRRLKTNPSREPAGGQIEPGTGKFATTRWWIEKRDRTTAQKCE